MRAWCNDTCRSLSSGDGGAGLRHSTLACRHARSPPRHPFLRHCSPTRHRAAGVRPVRRRGQGEVLRLQPAGRLHRASACRAAHSVGSLPSFSSCCLTSTCSALPPTPQPSPLCRRESGPACKTCGAGAGSARLWQRSRAAAATPPARSGVRVVRATASSYIAQQPGGDLVLLDVRDSCRVPAGCLPALCAFSARFARSVLFCCCGVSASDARCAPFASCVCAFSLAAAAFRGSARRLCGMRIIRAAMGVARLRQLLSARSVTMLTTLQQTAGGREARRHDRSHATCTRLLLLQHQRQAKPAWRIAPPRRRARAGRMHLAAGAGAATAAHQGEQHQAGAGNNAVQPAAAREHPPSAAGHHARAPTPVETTTPARKSSRRACGRAHRAGNVGHEAGRLEQGQRARRSSWRQRRAPPASHARALQPAARQAPPADARCLCFVFAAPTPRCPALRHMPRRWPRCSPLPARAGRWSAEGWTSPTGRRIRVVDWEADWPVERAKTEPAPEHNWMSSTLVHAAK
jgi:hypothetical protein